MSSKQPSRKRSVKTDQSKKACGETLAVNDPELLHMIRRLLAQPMEKRMHFLRVRHPDGGSHV